MDSTIQAALESADGIALTSDIWTSNGRIPFLAVPAHWADPDGDMMSSCLFLGKVTDHSAYESATIINPVIDRWRLPGRQTGMVTDNAYSAVAAVAKSLACPSTDVGPTDSDWE